VSARIGATGHRSGTAGLWYNHPVANSRFGATIAGSADTYYLANRGVSTLTLMKNATSGGPKKSVDVTVDRAVGGNPFKAFGTWTLVIP